MRNRALVIDGAVALVAFALSAAALGVSTPVGADLRDPDAGAYVLLAVYSGATVLRRRAPAAAMLVVVVAGLAYAGAQYPEAITPVGLLPIYTAGAEVGGRRGKAVLAAGVVLGWLGTTASPGPTRLSVPALIVAAWLLGRFVARDREYTAELERQNRLLEEAQQELAERAVTEERLRIARELHDVVAHTMSVVAVHAGSGRLVAATDPEAARQALATIETASRSALLEMRRLLGVLRGADGDRPGGLSPAPGLGDLDGLVAEVVRSGLTVDVRIEGDRGAVPAGVDLSAYRIVQEALTNVLKHAAGARATVVVRYAADSVSVEVTDDGPGATAPAGAGGLPSAGGHGLAGMRERVALYEGELVAGPGATGGFRVAARLPLGDTR